MKYSIVVVTHNSLEHTIRCVEALYQHTKDFELIVVDNASSDGTKGYLSDVSKQYPGMSVIFNDENRSFSAANNQGIAAAKGEYIVALNSDTVVTPEWLDRLTLCLENFDHPKMGMVGPVSNSSAGRQMVGVQDAEQWYAKHRGLWLRAGRLFGWCMLMKKSMLDEIGAFDERFTNSFEDNDLCLRAQLAGYGLAIAYDTYITHVGQATFSKMTDLSGYVANGKDNQKKFYDKYYDPKPRKLVAVYRTNGGAHLEESLRQTSRFADSIILHLCRARANVNETRFDALMKQFPKIVHAEFYDGPFQEDYERGRLLEIALNLQAEGRADWCISVDDDELYEDKFIDRVQAMMSPCNPEIFGYWCQWKTIWKRSGDKEFFRADSTFGSFSNYRFFRLIPGQKINAHGHPEGHHCFTEDAKIIVKDNNVVTEKKICDIKQGDFVLTHKGRFRKVLEVMKREIKEKVLSIRFRSHYAPLIATKDHPFMVNGGWKSLKDINKTDLLYTPKMQEETQTDIPADIARLWGYFLSDGGLTHIPKGVRFTFSGNQDEYAEDVSKILRDRFGLNAIVKSYQKPFIIVVNAYSVELAMMFAPFTSPKMFPSQMLSMSDMSKGELLKGFFRGDGCFDVNKRQIRFDNTSISVITGINLLLNALGFSSSINERIRENPKHKPIYRIAIQKKGIVERLARILDIPLENSEEDSFEEEFNQKIYKIDEVEFSGYVYNLSIEEDNSYVANGVAVHNCGSAPVIAPENLKWSKIRVKHLGYDTPEQRQRKYEFYRDNDHFPDPKDIGNKDYTHLIDEDVELKEYNADNGISLVMIVKNEEENILRCLEHIVNAVDEIVIADTGSTDTTKDIISEFAKYSPVPVKLLDYPWPDNYALARNYAKGFASNKWILHLDADEQFEDRDIAALVKLSEEEVDAYVFHVINYLEKPMAGKDPVYASSDSIRLFRNDIRLYYTGIVHETLDDALAALRRKRKIRLMNSPISLHHLGYLKKSSRVKEKFSAYVKYNEHQIEVTEGADSRPFCSLALHWLQEDKKDMALKSFQTALKIDPYNWHANTQMAAMNLNSAKVFLTNALVTLPEGHEVREQVKSALAFLNKYKYGHYKIDFDKKEAMEKCPLPVKT